jgi:ribonuclease HII
VASAVVLPARCRLAGVDDSKQLSERDREWCYEIIMARAVAVGIGSASAEEIDQLNILEATRLAMQRAVFALSPPPDLLLIDAVALPGLKMPFRSIIKGDALSLSIAAASIIAKVTRDRMMAEYDRIYPQYQFLSHKGYGTEGHVKALAEHGPCPIHRRTFAPVAAQIRQGSGAATDPFITPATHAIQ